MSAAAVVSTEPSPSMRRAISISLPIVLPLILLPVIAFAIPPVPSWIAGVFDGADADDIVSLVSPPVLCAFEMIDARSPS